MLTQFVAAFDGTFVYRYTKDKIAKEKINVRYVMGPKQRVLYDIVNQAKNLTLPVIAMEQKNIRRDPSRIQNKDRYILCPHINDPDISKIPQPIPVLIDVDVSMVANYKEDIDQIISNFIPWCNPYFIISWKIPEEFEIDFDNEIRSEVSWSGDVSFENPMDISAQDKYKIVGTTSFTIKGWIFPALEVPVAPIYVVRNDFHAVSSGGNLYEYGYDSYPTLSAVDYSTTDVITISAYPEFTNQFINGRPYDTLNINNLDSQTFTFYGKRYDFNNSWYLSSGNTIQGLTFEEITTAKFPTISAYRLPDDIITTVNDNIVSIYFDTSSVTLSAGDFVFVTSNEAGWGMSSPFTINAEAIYIVVTDDLQYNGIQIQYNGVTMIYSTTIRI